MSTVPIPSTRISPPAWGWPGGRALPGSHDHDFPTRVGMARADRSGAPRLLRFPHPRGDGPCLRLLIEQLDEISPPAWGWPAVSMGMPWVQADFPTRVGMARACTNAGRAAC